MSADELARFNTLPAAAARSELMECCSSPAWADRMLGGRPYSSARDAVRQSSAIVARLTVADLEAALSGHPRIGDRPAADGSAADGSAADGSAADGSAADGSAGAGRAAGRAAEWSRAEQSGVDAADAETARELAASNAEYEQRFGHIYLVSAAGRSGPQLLALLRTRLRNPPAKEWQVVRTELQKIIESRLRVLLAGTP
jgi:2-oxo-4-hydroxy-4-carboxy-5-ureidoimidazoline decarboxylase